MSKMWIVQGDITSSGGKVITGSPFTDIDGKPVARITDKATCPSHKGVFPIVDGDPTIVIDGQPVALHGSKLACGCSVLSVSQLSVFVDQGGTSGGGSRSSAPAGVRNDLAATALASNRPAAPTPAVTQGEFDEHFKLIDQFGKPLTGLRFQYFQGEQSVGEGCIDGHGCTHAHRTDSPTDICVAFEAPSPILE